MYLLISRWIRGLYISTLSGSQDENIGHARKKMSQGNPRNSKQDVYTAYPALGKSILTIPASCGQATHKERVPTSRNFRAPDLH